MVFGSVSADELSEKVDVADGENSKGTVKSFSPPVVSRGYPVEEPSLAVLLPLEPIWFPLREDNIFDTDGVSVLGCGLMCPFELFDTSDWPVVITSKPDETTRTSDWSEVNTFAPDNIVEISDWSLVNTPGPDETVWTFN